MSSGTPSAQWDDLRIRDHLSAERLSSYLRATRGDLSDALRLYEWNMLAAAAVIATTGMVEVIVRNALDARMVEWSTALGQTSWFDVAPLDWRGRDDITKARWRATGRGRDPELHGKVLAELSFGFWRYLVSQRYYASLWVPALHRAFPGGSQDIRVRRAHVESHLANLTFVRNRAAHHEPIHRRKLLNDLGKAVELATWIDPDAGAWIVANSTLRQVFAQRPDATAAVVAVSVP